MAEISARMVGKLRGCRSFFKKRIEHLMENFGDRIDYWDVFNEITVDHLYHNAVSRWIHEKGRANAVRYTTKLVRKINPHANLL